MKASWKDGKLVAGLHKKDEAVLEKARAIGCALNSMHLNSGKQLVDAIDNVYQSIQRQDKTE